MMLKRGVIVAVFAAMLSAQVPSVALANPDQNNSQQRDGHSRNEQTALQVLPLLLSNNAHLRLAMMVIMMQNLSYQLFMASGVNVTSQNRVNLGGLFGGLFAKTYSASDFLKQLEVGSVYLAGDDSAAIVLKGDMRLEDYRVILFNGENQYDITGRPELRQVDPRVLGQLAAITMMGQLLTYTLNPQAFNAMAEMQQNGTVAADLTPEQQTEIPLLRKRLIGKAYIGADNTLLIVIPPAIVLDR